MGRFAGRGMCVVIELVGEGGSEEEVATAPRASAHTPRLLVNAHQGKYARVRVHR
jgi:hypothetical protein